MEQVETANPFSDKSKTGCGVLRVGLRKIRTRVDLVKQSLSAVQAGMEAAAPIIGSKFSSETLAGLGKWRWCLRSRTLTMIA